MAKTEEGEFELILGNRQLISVFLVVVVLMGVFFSMGYIVGRNSASPSAEAARTAKSVPAETPVPAPDQPSSSPATPAQEPAATPAETTPPPSVPETTHPEQTAPQKPAPIKPAPIKPAPVTAAKSKPAPVGPATVTSEVSSGEYWQVVATARPDAELVAEVLLKKGFHAQVAPGPRDGVFRVLVGPFKDSAAQAETRTRLEAAGFKNPIMRKY